MGTKKFDMLLESFLDEGVKLGKEHSKLLRIKFKAIKDFLVWAKELEGRKDFHYDFKTKVTEGTKGLEIEWEKQKVNRDLVRKFLIIHEPNTKFWLRRVMLHETFRYKQCEEYTFKLMKDTLQDYTKVMVMHTISHLHCMIEEVGNGLE